MKLSKLRVLWNILGLILTGGSILLNFALYAQAKKYYLELNQTRLDPLGLGYYPVNMPEATGQHPVRVVFFGDSRAASWTAPSIDGYEFINRGISAQTSAQNIQRFADHVRPLKPAVVIVQVGINDLKTIALFPERRQSIVNGCQTNIKRIVQEARKLGAIVIVTTIFPVGDVPLERRSFWSDEIALAVKETNDFITTLAADQKIMVFDTFSLLADRQGLMLPQYRADELHFNKQGYVMLNEELGRLIKKIKLPAGQS
jgi:lysophospholipase L1-like esterase